MGTPEVTDDGSVKSDLTEWGADLAKRQAWLLHTATLAVGAVVRFYSGASGDRFKGGDDVDVEAPVLVLSTGHSFVMREREAFVELDDTHAAIYTDTVDALRRTIVESCDRAATLLAGRHEHPLPLILAALHMQIRMLEAGSS